MGGPTKLGVQGQDTHGHQSLVQRVLASRKAAILRAHHNCMGVAFAFALGEEPPKSAVKSERKRGTSFDFGVNLQKEKWRAEASTPSGSRNFIRARMSRFTFFIRSPVSKKHIRGVDRKSNHGHQCPVKNQSGIAIRSVLVSK